MNVFEISAALQEIEAAIELNEGVLTPQIEAEFNRLHSAKSDKLQALAKLIKKADADDLVISNEIQRLRTLQKTVEARRGYLEKLVRAILLEGETWQEGLDRFSWRKSNSVEVTDGAELPECYYRTKIITEVDKIKLSTDMKGGAVIPGVSYVTKFNLQVK
jgi:hypothetical protein